MTGMPVRHGHLRTPVVRILGRKWEAQLANGHSPVAGNTAGRRLRHSWRKRWKDDVDHRLRAQ